MMYRGLSSSAFPFYDSWYAFANSMRLNPFLWSASYSCRERVSTWEVILVEWQLMLFLGAVHETNLIPRLPEGSWCSGKQHTPDPGQGCIRVRVWLWLLISHKNNAHTLHLTPCNVSDSKWRRLVSWNCLSVYKCHMDVKHNIHMQNNVPCPPSP